jgi:hypothetical protein
MVMKKLLTIFVFVLLVYILNRKKYTRIDRDTKDELWKAFLKSGNFDERQRYWSAITGIPRYKWAEEWSCTGKCSPYKLNENQYE